MRNEDGERFRPQGLFKLYEAQPEVADELVFGRVGNLNRRGFVKGAGLATMASMVGASIPFAEYMPARFLPIALASSSVIEGKDGLVLLNDLPMQAETLPHYLDEPITRTENHFIRNNGVPPTETDARNWTLQIDGFVDNPATFSIDELKKRFEVVSAALVIECAGNGRAFFRPAADGGQWTYGAVGCSYWTGVRLAYVLEYVGVRSEAVYTAHYSSDTEINGENEPPLSRGIPISKAMDSHTLIAFAQNGTAMHPHNGAPLRLVVPGWPGACSQKWLTRIWIRDREHDGKKMTGISYRVPNRRIAPGEEIPAEDFEIIQSMPVKSLITKPVHSARVGLDAQLVRGHAWAGENRVRKVELSIDFGNSWFEAALDDPINPYAWQNFSLKVNFAKPGYYEIWTRATDERGNVQPDEISWNPKGYLNNSIHRIGIYAS